MLSSGYSNKARNNCTFGVKFQFVKQKKQTPTGFLKICRGLLFVFCGANSYYMISPIRTSRVILRTFIVSNRLLPNGWPRLLFANNVNQLHAFGLIVAVGYAIEAAVAPYGVANAKFVKDVAYVAVPADQAVHFRVKDNTVFAAIQDLIMFFTKASRFLKNAVKKILVKIFAVLHMSRHAVAEEGLMLFHRYGIFGGNGIDLGARIPRGSLMRKDKGLVAMEIIDDVGIVGNGQIFQLADGVVVVAADDNAASGGDGLDLTNRLLPKGVPWVGVFPNQLVKKLKDQIVALVAVSGSKVLPDAYEMKLTVAVGK